MLVSKRWVAPVAEWSRMLNLSTLNHFLSQCCGLELGHKLVTSETNQVLLAGGQVVFLWDLPFCPTLQLTLLKKSEIILKGCKPNQIKKSKRYLIMERKTMYWFVSTLFAQTRVLSVWIEKNGPVHNKMNWRPSEDLDQLGHPPSLIRDFTCAHWVAKEQSFLWADIQADLSLRRVHRSLCWFCHAAAQILLLLIWSSDLYHKSGATSPVGFNLRSCSPSVENLRYCNDLKFSDG